jgi:hypothetical protein
VTVIMSAAGWATGAACAREAGNRSAPGDGARGRDVAPTKPCVTVLGRTEFVARATTSLSVQAPLLLTALARSRPTGCPPRHVF